MSGIVSRRYLFNRAVVGALPFLTNKMEAWQSSKPKLVVVGSSTAAGAGASRRSFSWAALWAASLELWGIEVINVSVGGHSSSDALARLDADVFSLAPADVVFATNVFNDGFASPRWPAVVDGYIKRTEEAVARVERTGARAWLIGQLPCDAYVHGQEAGLESVYRHFDETGLLINDAWGNVNDPSRPAVWSEGLSPDGVHPNDAGHRLLFESIQPRFGELISDPSFRLFGRRSKCANIFQVDFANSKSGESTFPVVTVSDVDLRSRCFHFEIRPTRLSGRSLILVSDERFGQTLEVVGGDLVLRQADGPPLSLSVTVVGGRLYRFTYCVNMNSGVVSVWCDQKQIWRGLAERSRRTNGAVSFLFQRPDSDATAWRLEVGNVRMFRTSLGDTSLTRLGDGEPVVRALDLFLRADSGRNPGLKAISIAANSVRVVDGTAVEVPTLGPRGCR